MHLKAYFTRSASIAFEGDKMPAEPKGCPFLLHKLIMGPGYNHGMSSFDEMSGFFKKKWLYVHML